MDTDDDSQPIVGGRHLWDIRCDKPCAGLSNCKWLLFLVMLPIQFVGLILFSIWDIDCFFREFHTTATCQQFDLFPIPQLFECLWLFNCSAVSLFLIYNVVHHSSEFPNTARVVRHLVKKKYFYKISFVVLVVLIYDVYVMINDPKAWKTIAAVLFIMEKFFTVVLMFLINFLPRFLSNGESNRKRFLYKVALGLYVLQNFLIALVGSTNAVYKVLTVAQSESKPNVRPRPKAVVDLMLLITNNGYRYFVAEFFFSKLFDENLNILGGGTIEESIGNQEVDGDNKENVGNDDQQVIDDHLVLVPVPKQELTA